MRNVIMNTGFRMLVTRKKEKWVYEMSTGFIKRFFLVSDSAFGWSVPVFLLYDNTYKQDFIQTL